MKNMSSYFFGCALMLNSCAAMEPIDSNYLEECTPPATFTNFAGRVPPEFITLIHKVRLSKRIREQGLSLPNIVWLSGNAGEGKTTIVQDFAQIVCNGSLISIFAQDLLMPSETVNDLYHHLLLTRLNEIFDDAKNLGSEEVCLVHIMDAAKLVAAFSKTSFNLIRCIQKKVEEFAAQDIYLLCIAEDHESPTDTAERTWCDELIHIHEASYQDIRDIMHHHLDVIRVKQADDLDLHALAKQANGLPRKKIKEAIHDAVATCMFNKKERISQVELGASIKRFQEQASMAKKIEDEKNHKETQATRMYH